MSILLVQVRFCYNSNQINQYAGHVPAGMAVWRIGHAASPAKIHVKSEWSMWRPSGAEKLFSESCWLPT